MTTPSSSSKLPLLTKTSPYSPITQTLAKTKPSCNKKISQHTVLIVSFRNTLPEKCLVSVQSITFVQCIDANQRFVQQVE